MVSPDPALRFVPRRPGADNAVVLDRVDDIAQSATPYCVHGRSPCISCGAWCWLGSATHDLVSSGEALPLCKPCANRLVPKGPLGTAVAVGNAGDHLRQDGPH
jgi:hypothetical protein